MDTAGFGCGKGQWISAAQQAHLCRHMMAEGIYSNQDNHGGSDNHGADEAYHVEPAEPLEGLDEQHGENQDGGTAHSYMEAADAPYACMHS